MKSEIVRPVRRESASDAFYIVDADGKCVADCIARQEWADEIVKSLNEWQGAGHNKSAPAKQEKSNE